MKISIKSWKLIAQHEPTTEEPNEIWLIEVYVGQKTSWAVMRRLFERSGRSET